jgi:hypothetical protein
MQTITTIGLDIAKSVFQVHGNAGGAKGPDFWCAFEDGEVVVIGHCVNLALVTREPSTEDIEPDQCLRPVGCHFSLAAHSQSARL